MRKLTLLPLGALLLGVAGAALRGAELTTVFDPVSGLPQRGAGVSAALIILFIAVLALSLAAAIVITLRLDVPEIFEKAYYTGSYLSFAVRAVLGATLIVMAVVCTFGRTDLMALSGLPRLVFIAFMILSGAGMVVMAYYSYTQRAESTLLRLGSVMPAIFYCYWMVALYRINAGNPVILDYCYGCLALGGAAMSSYYAAGFTYKRKNIFGTVFVSLLSIFLLTVSLADSYPIELKAVLAATAIYITDSTARFLSSMEPKARGTTSAEK